jgi:hypothetical protein
LIPEQAIKSMNIKNAANRPKTLSWLCTGSIVFGASWFVMLLLLLISEIRGEVPAHLFPRLVAEYAGAGKIFLLAELALTGIGIWSVTLMWQMKKAGFYLYASIKTLAYFLPALVIGADHLTFPALITTAIMISAYGIFFTSKSNHHKKQEKE